jgi:GNAT superfamily N-acetyltransferase
MGFRPKPRKLLKKFDQNFIFVKEGIVMYEYRAASPDDLNSIWDKNIRDNPGDLRWVAWKAHAIEDNRKGICKTFVVLYDGVPIGEGTLLFSPDCGAVRGRKELADGVSVTNINALRNDKAHENKGHISKLMKRMEEYARALGYQTITIGVEAKEARNLAIYLHWGYTTLVAHEVEDGELVLYYGKALRGG